jgi:drug/metabolite transporter (DMT)-like permease
VFWFSVTASALSTITIFWGWVIPAPREAIFLIIAGLLGGVGQILLTSSYRLADASVIAPFEYTSMLLAIGVGFFVFGEVPTKVMLLGAAIIISAGVIIILREHYLGLERAKQRKAMTPSG